MSSPLLAHHDTPPCPRCWANTVVPRFVTEGQDGPNAAQMACACCGHEWEEKRDTSVDKAWQAQRAWAKYSSDALLLKTKARHPK